ncbi:MAG: efflux RND transporter permease subunit [bacterium]
MISKTLEYSVKNPVVVIVATLGLVAWGVHSIATTPIDAIPDLSENQVIVFADWTGRSPQEIEDQVTYPLSVNLQGLAGVKAVRSTSEFNFSMINIIFDDDVDFYFARERVLEKLSTSATFLPQGVVPYLAPDATALGQIFWYTVEGEGKDLAELRALQDWYVRYQLASVPGVAQVASVGGFVKSYEIAIQPDRLRAYGVTLGEIAQAVSRGNSAVGGDVFVKNDAEYLIRGVGWLKGLDDLRETVVAQRGGTPVTLGQLGTVGFEPLPRRAVLEKDGREAVGGVVLMRYGENPLRVTERIHDKIAELSSGLPEGVRIVPFYERTRLIHGAIDTVTRVLREEMIVAAVAILLILGHFGSAAVVVATLPLAVLVSFVLMRLFQIPSNIMSLSGIAISIGILVDASIVMVENATHTLTARFGKEPVRGDTRAIVLESCKLVGRPIFFSILIMLLSFLPVFALKGMEGKMFHPLAFTKSFAMIGVALLSITFVPAMLPLALKGRLRSETENPIVRSFIGVYRPVLSTFLRHPRPFLLGFAALLGVGWSLAGRLGREFMPPLDEGAIMDMPVTIPSVSVPRAAEDLKIRDAVLRSFPEVESVVGKSGRADTPTDPAPPDMVETVVNLVPRTWWTERTVRFEDAAREAERTVRFLAKRGVVKSDVAGDVRASLVNDAAMNAVADVDGTLRQSVAAARDSLAPALRTALVRVAVDDVATLLARKRVLRRELSGDARARLAAALAPRFGPLLAVQALRSDVAALAAAVGDSLVAGGEVEARSHLLTPLPSWIDTMLDPVRALAGRERPTFEESLQRKMDEARDRFWRARRVEIERRLDAVAPGALLEALALRVHEAASSRGAEARVLSRDDVAALRQDREKSLARGLFLAAVTKDELVQEMDSALRVPGWGNIWTQPIVNRIDMLATGVRTMVGVKVFGDDLKEIQRISDEIADVVRKVPGAVDVFPDQTVGENYVEIDVDRARAARYGVNVADVQDVIETAIGGMTITSTVEGRRRFPVRVRYARDFRVDADAIGRILVSGSAAGGGTTATSMDGAAATPPGGPQLVPLSSVATIRVVEGPSMIKSENGLLRSYVQLNVRGRDVVGFVEEAQRRVSEGVKLPAGMYVEWSGQFESQVRARRTLQIVFPAVIGLILLVLYLTFKDVQHALLMVLAVPGALVGGVIFQTIFHFDFSVAVWVGYIAAFGMATETGIVMMVYLRDALARRGGIAAIKDEAELRETVLEGAVHRLRPKLLTEAVAIVGLMPMLWAHGTGAEVMRPMAAPVLGGLLVADEVIDLLLPILFYRTELGRWQRRRRDAAPASTR